LTDTAIPLSREDGRRSACLVPVAQRERGSTIIDLQKQQATVFSATDIVYPEVTDRELFARYDFSVLTKRNR
jgi:hypothetical protein